MIKILLQLFQKFLLHKIMSQTQDQSFEELQIGNYIIISKLGSGSFASVWLAQHTITGFKVAIKIIYKSSLTSEEAVTRFNRECALLKQMDHPFISDLFEIIEDPENYYLIMEYVDHGNMLNYVNTNGRLSEDRARHYFCQLVSALDYLHNEKFVAHRDLKAENVLLDVHDNIRLIDFGLSNVFSKDSPELKTACGSPAYAAPEMIQGHPYTKAADIWSAGILLYAMVVGRLPYDDPNIQKLLTKIVTEEVHYPSSLSFSLVDLLKRLLVKNPEQRITLTRLKEHPWFSQSEYKTIMEFNYFRNTGGNVFYNPSPFPTATSNFMGNFNGTFTQVQPQPMMPMQMAPPQFAAPQYVQAAKPFPSVTHSSAAPKTIDSYIVSQMAGFGIDVRNLPASLMANEWNEITAIYRELKKAKTTEQMKDLMLMMERNAAFVPGPSVPPPPTSPQPSMQFALQNVRKMPPPKNLVSCNRRMSRPVILKKMPPIVTQPASQCI